MAKYRLLHGRHDRAKLGTGHPPEYEPAFDRHDNPLPDNQKTILPGSTIVSDSDLLSLNGPQRGPSGQQQAAYARFELVE